MENENFKGNIHIIFRVDWRGREGVETNFSPRTYYSRLSKQEMIQGIKAVDIVMKLASVENITWRWYNIRFK